MNRRSTTERAGQDDNLRADSAGRIDRIAVAASASGIVYFVVHCLHVIFGSEMRVMEWLYDDCFYYLITAKHLSEQHRSSFDGITLTSGYHPLWMWICTSIYHLHGKLDLTYVRGCMGVSFCLAAGMLFVAFQVAVAKRDNGLLWALAIAATSYSALNNGITVMEWPLVVLCWMALHYLVARATPNACRERSMGAILACFVVGIAGSLSRTDFGLIAGCYLLASFFVARRSETWRLFKYSAAAVGGSVLGIAIELAYNHRMTGEWLQKSAEVKRTFASLTVPFNPAPAAWQFLRVLLYLPALRISQDRRSTFVHDGMIIIGMCVAGVVLLLILKRKWTQKRINEALARGATKDLALWAAVFGVIGYLVLYAFDSQAVYGWYTAAVTGFVVLIAARLLGSAPRAFVACIIVPVMLCNVMAAEYFGGNARDQMQEVAVGKRMHAENRRAVMGGGDVGKPSFYNDGTLINLDGLMNNEAYPYLISGTIHCYVLKRHIEFLSDIGSITMPLTDAERAKLHKPPLPWDRYFSVVASSDRSIPDQYFRSNFEAIRASGECGPYNHQ